MSEAPAYAWPFLATAPKVVIPSYVVVPPAVEPVTLDEIKLDRRVVHTFDDIRIQEIIGSAREYCEFYTGQSFVTQTREVGVTSYEAGMALPFGPIQLVTDVGTADPVIVRYIAGWAPVAGSDPVDYIGNVPKTYKQAIRMLVGAWYDNTEEYMVGGVFTSAPIGVHALLGWNRQRRGFA